MFLLDSDICIAVTKRNRLVLKRFDQLTRSELNISAVTAGELLLGVPGAWNPAEVELDLQQLWLRTIMRSVDLATAKKYALIRYDLKKRGEIIGANDLWIAAHALALDLTLVTNNEREFRRVPNLRIENWTTPA